MADGTLGQATGGRHRREIQTPGPMTGARRTSGAGRADHGDIRGGEVIAGAQHGMTGALGKRVSEAIAEIQAGRVPSLAVPSPAAHCACGHVSIEWPPREFLARTALRPQAGHGPLHR